MRMGKKTISENELIKNSCKIEMHWQHEQNQWVVKINHITDEVSYSGVKITMEGFENFRDAVDEAIKLFKRNIRNNIKENQVVKVKFAAEDVWPELLFEKS
jgi:hypothetical protein